MKQVHRLIEYICNHPIEGSICITIANSGSVFGSIISPSRTDDTFNSTLDTCYSDFIEWICQEKSWIRTKHGSILTLKSRKAL